MRAAIWRGYGPPGEVLSVGEEPLFATTTTADLEALAGLVESGKVRVPVAATFGLARADRAFDLVGTGHAGGKVVVRVRG